MYFTYSLVWSESQTACAPIPKFVRSRCVAFKLRVLSVALVSAVASNAFALPKEGQVAVGQGSIAKSDGAMTITQQSQNLAINWQTFGIGAKESVVFIQPNACSIALNRILGTDPSQIYGRLASNGQVWVLNPNGILFGSGAQVNVGGLLASTLKLSDADFLSGKRSFTGNGGTVTNQGRLIAADGGYIALLGGRVSNEGLVQARLGTVAMGAGNQITLDFGSDKLLNLQVDQGAVKALVQNKQLIQADGGTVLMSAKTASALLNTVVNNEGVIEARTIDNHNGTIKLLGGMAGGTVQVGGALDASALNGGNGGFIETSGAAVKLTDSSRITTAAPMGQTGQWLIGQQDFTVATRGGDTTGTALGARLGTNNILIQSSSGGAGGSGNVNINDGVKWNANTTLSLTASNNVNVNASITATGLAAGVAINPNTANGSKTASGTGVFNLGAGAAINLPNVSPTSTTALVISGASYTVINSLGAEGSITGTDLQGMNGNLTKNYALGSNMDAASTAAWSGGAGFMPIGSDGLGYGGILDGLGHQISSLVINRASPFYNNVGLIRALNAGAVMRNVGRAGGSTYGYNFVGGLVGSNAGSVSNSYNTGTVFGRANAGGLVGSNAGSVSNSYNTGTVGGQYEVGGLVGSNYYGSISISYNTGAVAANVDAGGLVGNNAGSVSNAYNTGSVNSHFYAGGVVGNNAGSVSNTYSTGAVHGDNFVGGLLGGNSGTVSNSYWDTTTSGQSTSAGGTGLTTAQMTQRSNLVGFDFTNIWSMYDGQTYPLLRSFVVPRQGKKPKSINTYDGLAFSSGNGATDPDFSAVLLAP